MNSALATNPIQAKVDTVFRISWLALLLGFAVLMLCGCAHQARIYQAPNSVPLEAASRKLGSAVIASKQAVSEASAAVKEAKKNHDAEAATIATIQPKVSDLLRAAPVELRPAVQSLETDVEALRGLHDITAHAIDAAQGAQARAGGQLEIANAAKNQAAEFQSQYLEEVAKLTEQANRAETGWAKDSKALSWYRLHFLGAWILAGGGVLVCLLLAFLKYTGRIAMAARA